MLLFEVILVLTQNFPEKHMNSSAFTKKPSVIEVQKGSKYVENVYSNVALYSKLSGQGNILFLLEIFTPEKLHMHSFASQRNWKALLAIMMHSLLVSEN